MTGSDTNPLFRKAKLGPKNVLESSYPSKYISGTKKHSRKNSGNYKSKPTSPCFTPKEPDCRRICLGMVNTMR